LQGRGKGVQSANGLKRIVVNCGIQVTVRKGKGYMMMLK
jgi:hypothetical protein